MPNSEDYAIVVGITDYASFPRLLAAAGDATAFAEWLRSPDGGDIPADQVKLIVSSNFTPAIGEKSVYPWKNDVDHELAGIIANRTGRIGRRFYFYFSGHGCVPSADAILLLMANTSKDAMQENVGARPYRNWLWNAALFDELVFILDCCLEADGLSAEPEPPCLTPVATSPDFIRVKPLVALGTAYGQSAYAPNVAHERSFFTKHLLDGLRGKAATADGSITTKSLSEYVVPRVELEMKKLGFEQSPDIPEKPEIVFRKGTQGQRLLTFMVPAEWTRPLELRDGLSNVVRRTKGSERKFQAVLVPGCYQIRYPAEAGVGAATPATQILRVAPTGDSAVVVLDPQGPGEGHYDV